MTTFLEQQFGLGGQVAVVFGAASGIGRRCAAFLSKAGARVCLADLDGEAARAAAEALDPGGPQAGWAAADVSDEGQVAAAFARAEAELGPVSVVVNSAGVFPSIELEDQSVEAWDRIQAVNLRGAFLCVREGARAIRRAGRGGRIVLISSTTSLTPGVPTLGAYSSSKAGVNALVRTAAMEYARDGITVNAVAPGDTLTEGAMKAQMAPRALPFIEPRSVRRPISRFGAPEDIAQAVLAFAAPGAEYVTGQVLVIDGGQMTS
jgi:NAD(P)-dependent dehydrogenase (short-subunit alcohol dehydrogenase family)